MKVRATVCGALTLLSGVPAIAAPAGYDRPVRVGGEAELDACGSVAKVVGLNPRGDNFLAVKSGPDLRARRTDKLGPGALVYVCATAPGTARGRAWFTKAAARCRPAAA